MTFSLLSAKGSENKNLAAIVLNILKISKDSIKESNRFISLQNFVLFTLYPRIIN